MRRTPLKALVVASVAALAAPLLGAQLASADTIQVDPDGDTAGGSAAVVSSGAGNCATGETRGSITLNFNPGGKNHFTANGAVLGTFQPVSGDQVLTGTGITGTLVTAQPTVPTGWGADVQEVTYAFALHVSSTTPIGSYQIALQLIDEATGNTAGAGGGGRPKIKLDVFCVPDDSGTPQNQAPTVSIAAADQEGDEGGTLVAGGAFADDGGAANLTITQLAGAGSVTDNRNGTWSWTHTPEDNFANQAVVVQAMDGEGATATDAFEWTSDNVAPVISSVVVTPTADCSVDLQGRFTDVGAADTHIASVDWADGASSTPAAVAGTPVSASHVYSTAGTYTASLTVTDDDGGTDAKSASSSFTPELRSTAGPVLAPLVTSGSRSAFKVGSVIPIKIVITACDGSHPSNLAPVVSIDKTTGVFSGPVTLQSVASQPATVGINMRWATDKYMYNFSTKNSQLGGGALAAGDYAVSLTAANMKPFTPVAFRLQK